MPPIARRFSLLAVMLLFGVTMVRAQEGQTQGQAPHTQTPDTAQQQNTSTTLSPSPAVQPADTGAPQTGDSTPQTPSSSARQPLTGAEEFTLSRMGASHSYFVPSLQYAQSMFSTGIDTFPTSNLESISTISGVFALHHVWRRYDFTAQYSGVGLLYYNHPDQNTSAHNFAISQRIDGKRSSLLLTDVVTYLPESSYGYARFGGLDTFGGGYSGYGGVYTGSTGGLNTVFLPDQSILTGASSQVGNSVVAQYDYLTSPLSSVTLTGSYVSLFFPGSQLINYKSAIVRIGYDRSISPKNSIGLFYQGGAFWFGSSGVNFTNHDISLDYRRAITHRFAFEAGAGPQVNVFQNSVLQQNVQFSWQAQALLSYQLERMSLGIDYHHYTSGGSGVYQGAHTDTVGVRTSLPFSRTWATDLSLGYAYNTSLQAHQLLAGSSSYNSWYGTINLQHTVNRWMSLFVGYNLRQQMSSQTTCVGTACGTFYAQQYFTFGINWHPNLPGAE